MTIATVMGTSLIFLAVGWTGQAFEPLVLVVGVFLAVTMELCGIKALSFAIGVYLPLATTLPIFIGGAIRGLVEYRQKKEAKELSPEEEELGKGNLFATGLVAGGAVAGVLFFAAMGWILYRVARKK